MTPPHVECSPANVYDLLFRKACAKTPADDRTSVLRVLEAYLDGKPATQGKHKFNQASRDAAFWSSAFVEGVPMDAWRSELGGLVLARYLAQDRVASEALLARIAESAPEALDLAVRRYDFLRLRNNCAITNGKTNPKLKYKTKYFSGLKLKYISFNFPRSINPSL